MNAIGNYEAKLADIYSLIERAKAAEALRALDHLMLVWPEQPALLVLRGELIQMQDQDGPDLDEASAALKRATRLDPSSANAWLEFAQFQFAVKDNAKAAEKSFAIAISTASEVLIAALIGRAGALEELGKRREAFECLHVARSLQDSHSTGERSEFQEEDLFDRWDSLIGES